MPSNTTMKCDTRQNRGQFAKTYSGPGIAFQVLCQLPTGELLHFVHSDPRMSVKTWCERKGVNFDEAIVEPLR